MDSPDPDTTEHSVTVPTREPQADELLTELASKQLCLSPANDPSLNPAIFILPFEIVAEIFTFYNAKIYNTPDYDMNSKKGRSGPLQLAAVCRMWREIALTTPHLWTTVNIFVSSLPQIPLFAELVVHWMSRSGQLTLNIGISVSKWTIQRVKRFRGQWNDVSPLFDVIRSSSPRWRQLTLGIPAELYEDFLGTLTTAPLLEDLRIVPLVAHERTCTVNFHLPSAPRLRLLQLSTVYVDKIKIPWQNLTSIQAHSIFVDEMLEIVKCADQLLSARFSGICGNGSVFPLPAKPLTHYLVRHLDLRPGDNGLGMDLDLFFENITFPSLESFVYHSQDVFPVNYLLSLFTRSRCAITNFEIVIPADTPGPNLTEEELIRLLEGVPTITRLSISLLEPLHREIVTGYFLESVSERASLLPHLEVLNFVGWRAFSWEAIADMLTFKDPSRVKLRLVNISSNRNKDENADTIPFIDKPTVSRLLYPRNPQMIVKILDITTGTDLIAGSLAFHGLASETRSKLPVSPLMIQAFVDTLHTL